MRSASSLLVAAGAQHVGGVAALLRPSTRRRGSATRSASRIGCVVLTRADGGQVPAVERGPADDVVEAVAELGDVGVDPLGGSKAGGSGIVLSSSSSMPSGWCGTGSDVGQGEVAGARW
jgi:hypothetical protein